MAAATQERRLLGVGSIAKLCGISGERSRQRHRLADYRPYCSRIFLTVPSACNFANPALIVFSNPTFPLRTPKPAGIASSDT